MNRRKLSHVIAAGILAGLLVLPGPALAEALRGREVSLWQSLAKLWQHELAVLLSKDRLLRKEGYGIDPNGGKPTGSNLANPSPSEATNSEGITGSGL
jgi:hypothetical protein